ncbi:hypothetical protein Moror_4107 [Moniliophthora roreri MCA 2997]|uniref:Uncharacterized protein n=1 Tax=Moniliophthora roreri (strain MCA 2997) TaxID=1381753 RepID=V2YGD1_MONRO|nr:hypothetical protein Moror_4107 [Moniliophthora roreri MCA 2997]
MSNPEDSAIKSTTTEDPIKEAEVEGGAGAVKDELVQKDPGESAEPEAAAPSGDAKDDFDDDDDEPVPPGHNARGRTTNAASGLTKPVKR